MEFAEEVELAGEGQVEEDEADGEDDADEALGEEVEGGDGGEAEAWGGWCESAASLRTHVLRTRDDRAPGFVVVLSFVDAVEGDEEEVDGEGHPEGDEDVRDVEAGVEVGADAGGHGEGGVEAGAVGGDRGPA